MDDILVYIEHHLKVMKKAFKTLAENKLELQVTKCHFLLIEINYMGYKILEKG